ncbi:hypothetical protein LTR04_001783, partial [Oleoguttula sp. CCFEE 6159]
AAWLYERHFAQMRAQMKKVGASNTPTPVPGTSSTVTVAGGLLMKRLESGGSGQSSTTMHGERLVNAGSRAPPESALETTVEDQHNEALERSLSPPAVSSSSSDTDSDAGLQSTRQSQTFRRPPRFNNASKSPLGILSDGDDDDDAANFLPFANLPKQTVQDSSATLRTDSKANDKQSAHRPHPSKAPLVRNQQRVESSASSASSNPQGQRQRPPGALSPHHRAELAKLSPRHRKEGSDGTPSMGSSFSDLDGARNFNNRSLNSSSDSSIYEHPLYNA